MVHAADLRCGNWNQSPCSAIIYSVRPNNSAGRARPSEDFSTATIKKQASIIQTP